MLASAFRRRRASSDGLRAGRGARARDCGLKTVVTWTLTPEAGGTRVRMEQSGFRPQDEAAHRGAGYGWRRLVAGLECVAGELT